MDRGAIDDVEQKAFEPLWEFGFQSLLVCLFSNAAKDLVAKGNEMSNGVVADASRYASDYD